MENAIPERELKPIVVEVEPPMRSEGTVGTLRKRNYYQARNLPEREPGVWRRSVGALLLTEFGLVCNPCGHIMPKLSKVPGYSDIFLTSNNGHKGEKWKERLYCPKCSSEILLEDWKIISGAAEYYPPGAERTRGPIVIRPTPVPVGASVGNNK